MYVIKSYLTGAVKYEDKSGITVEGRTKKTKGYGETFVTEEQLGLLRLNSIFKIHEGNGNIVVVEENLADAKK